ncbi:MAG: sugar phosphate nucleotidyltransferase [Actinobacteria bacterium]|nr:sugar phosphate nucleotidyltransferase [Actinomycetota bacterium]MCL6094894.1 sugar phosphate nucleotidyltransferase [Actinomycetota bacterium]
MKAVIMAGGEGTRLKPLTSNQPKPMLPIANRPMMEHVVALLRQHGFTDIVVTVAYMANAIRTYFGDGSEFGVRMVYATEERPLGTAGSVMNAREELNEPFLVISGDVLTDLDLTSLAEFHKSRGCIATIAIKAVENPLEFGIVITHPDGSIVRFLEKPGWGEVFSDTINTGVYILEPEIFDFIPEAKMCDFAGDVFPALLAAGKPLFGCPSDGYWEDVGTLDAYVRAHQDIMDGKVQVDIEGFPLRPGIWLGEGAEVDPNANLEGPAIIGDNCVIGPEAHIGRYSVIGRNTRVKSGAFIERSVVHDNAYLGQGVRLSGCVVGRSSDLRQGVICEEGVVLGEECFVGAQAVVKAGVKIYPFKTVESGAIVNSSIVWESRGARSLFGRLGVAGLANVDITPELAVRLSMAYASHLKKGDRIVASRDSSRAARVLKRAMMVGCNAAGVNVDDLEVATVPVTRFQIRASSCQGGFTVRLASDDPMSIVIRFFDERGIDLAEPLQRKIERIYYREEFRRALASEIGEIGFPARTLELYAAALLEGIDLPATQAAKFKLVLDYAHGAASLVMPNALARLGADVLVVNPYLSSEGAMDFDQKGRLNRVAELVVASGAHLGAVIDADGERIQLVDDMGHILSSDEFLLLMLSLLTAVKERVRVALPVAASKTAEDICRANGGEILWTKLSSAHLMEVASSEGADFAASQDGGFIFPDFLPAYDGVAALLRLVSLIAGRGLKLSKLVSSLPKVHIAHQGVITPWESKGMLMRAFLEKVRERQVVLVDGVKVVDEDGWALVLPDPEEPLTHVWAESNSEAEARAKAQEYSARLRQLLQQPA